MKNLKNKFSKALRRLVVNYKRRMQEKNTEPLSAFEKEVLYICRNLIRSHASDLLVCPDTNRRFIIYDPMQIKVIVGDTKIIFSNHDYYFELSISGNGITRLIRVFNGNVRARRDVLESEIKLNAKTTLNRIALATSFQTKYESKPN